MEYKFADGRTVEVADIKEATEIKDMFKVNLPSTYENYINGNGEGVWACGDEKTKLAYDNDVSGGIYFVMILNDSGYYPDLTNKTIIPVEMRGEKRPTAIFDELKAKYGMSHREEFIEKIAKFQHEEQ